ncbi:MFS transporter [Nocardioides sp.]|uniref:MFS transporter n=1 Tax=Nocardioides sp. TaxID=35761 RepID=UPI002ED3ACA7
MQVAFLGSAVGDWAYATAIVVWAYDAGGARAVGIWLGIRFVLGALTAPIGAVYADRWSRRGLMMLTDALRAVAVAGAAVLIAVDLAAPMVFVLATLTSLLASPFLIAQRALLPGLSRTPAELAAANGLHSTIDSLAFFAGPALAAGLLVATDVPVVLVVNVLTFLWSLALVSRVVVPRAEGPRESGADESDESQDGASGPEETFLAETLAGFRIIGRDRVLLLTTVQVSLQTVIAGAMTVCLVVMADEILDSPDAGLGYLNAVIGVGSILGGMLAISRARRGTLGRDMTVGVVLWSLPLLLVTAWPTPAACFAAAALLGLANPLVDVNIDTIMQRLTPDELLGRVFGALESCAIATMAIGALAMPLLLELMSLQAALAVLAVPVAALALIGLPAMIRLDATLTAPRGLELLRSLDLFAPLDPATTEQLAGSLTEVRFAAGDVLVREGEESDRFFVVESGLVRVTQTDALGERVLRTEGAGEYFGEIGLLRDVPRTATITALEETVVLTLARDDFLRAVSGHRESGLAAEATIRRRLAT